MNINSLDVKSEITEMKYDSKWLSIDLTDSFKNYYDNNTARYRKIGKFVEVVGILRPTKEIQGSQDWVNIAILPEGFRPSSNIYQVCHGSIKNTWLLSIDTTGAIKFGRYGTDSYKTADINTWLPFTISFMVD